MDIDKKILDDFANALIQFQKKVFNSELKKSNIEHYREGIIESINEDGTASVSIAFDLFENVPNFSGVSLSEKQKVKVFYNRKNMSDCYIGVAF